MSLVPYIQYSERVVGENSPLYTDVANRPLKYVIAQSGLDDTQDFLGLASGGVGDGSPESARLGRVGDIYGNRTAVSEHPLWYKYTGNNNTIGWKNLSVFPAGLTVETGTTSLGGDLSVLGNTTLGNAVTDSIVLTARLASDILPIADDTYSIGSAVLHFSNAYFSDNVEILTAAYLGTSVADYSTLLEAGDTFLATTRAAIWRELAAATFKLGSVGGTIAAPTPTPNGQGLGTFSFRGYDGTIQANGASVSAITTELWSATNKGTYLQFTTVLTGTTANNARLIIDGSGHTTPGITATYDLGTASVLWRSLYLGTHIQVGSNVSTTGAIRLANTGTISWRNAANSADIAALTVDASNQPTLGGTNSGSVLISPGGTLLLTISTASVSVADTKPLIIGNSGYIQLGTTNPASGNVGIRVRNNQTILTARNAANTLNQQLMIYDNSNNFTLSAGAGGVRLSTSTAYWELNTSAHWVPQTTNSYDLGTSAVTIRTGYFGTSVIVGTDPGGAQILRIGGASIFAGDLQVGTNTTAYQIKANGAAGQTRDIAWFTANSARWVWRVDGSAESGSDAGSGIALNARTDAGTSIDNVLSVIRAAGGLFNINRPVSFNGSIRLGSTSAPSSDIQLQISNLTGTGTSLTGYHFAPTAPATATASVTGYYSRILTTASIYTLTTAYGLYIEAPSIGVGSTITSGYGIRIVAATWNGSNGFGIDIGNVTGATNNFAVRTGTGLVQFGDDVIILGSGGANPATVGVVRFPNNASMRWRNAANSNNIIGLSVSTSNNVLIGDVQANEVQLTAGSSQVLRLTNTGHWVWNTDNTTDLGASAATRPRTGYFGTSIVIGTDPTGTQALRVGGLAHILSTTANQLRLAYSTSQYFDFNITSVGALELLPTGTTFNLSIFAAGSFGSGKGVIFIANATTVPTTNPTGGGILYVESGALKYRGSGGTVSTIAPA